MRPEQLEAWVLSLVDQVASGSRVEDSRVELKAQWPEPRVAARRIAGHANSSGGDNILWVIGLDEVKGVVRLPPINIAAWAKQVAAEFDGVEPSLTDLAVPTADGTLIALLFDAARRPFVVKNVVHGSTGGGPVAFEVPWRSGTAIRSARREDLLRILVPTQALPTLELLSASASADRYDPAEPGYGGGPEQQVEHTAWNIRVTVYVTPRTSDLLVLPVHKATLTFRHGEGSAIVAKVRLRPPSWHVSTGSVRDSHTITATSGEAVLTGPGRLDVTAMYHEPVRSLPRDEPLEIEISLIPAGQDRAVGIATTLKSQENTGDFKRTWRADIDLESA
jgi:hypothetical protein